MSAPRLSRFLADQTTGDPHRDAVLREHTGAVLIKGSFATGLAGPASDLDVWLVREPHRVPSPGPITSLLEAYLMANIPQALDADPPVEVDIIDREDLATQWRAAHSLVRDAATPSWADIEMVHELATSRWVMGSPPALGWPPLPRGPVLTKVTSRWYQSRANATFRAVVHPQDPATQHDPGTARAMLAQALAELCSAVLAGHGLDNPKAKWRTLQAERLGGPAGAKVAHALTLVVEPADAATLEAAYAQLSELLPS